ncbi:NADP-dependent oxidoreductase [Neorhizobium alkalisoli]|uniref:NADPH:quinone reductase-like Zn-dependent oxidoreductase n=1 Tax=Neorhizobium alkalisoli TaxID=528178 RepID=A0A561QBA5_9HYPH|nr:NADP-dependent oxidoreductase [Neorhizobium alkalisoli]TWF47607.1 NADPH:quinone reductase-like Zn-dependent oxidoreductase [Neorhizobium alkalisoli]
MPSMRAVRIHEFGSENVLRLERVERPEPGGHEVLIKVMAASVNPVDWKTRKGEYAMVGEDDLPLTLGRDLAGEVAAVGNRVSEFKVGDRIFAMLDAKHGGYEEFASIPVSQLVGMPAGLSFDEAAAVPLAGMTAWQGLFQNGNLKAGQRVLIHGGGGGVGHFAIQFAKAKGAWVATTVSPADASLAKELGADQVIDYHSERFEEVIDPVDLVLDLIGGETQDRSFAILKEGGVIVSTLGEPDKAAAERSKVRAVGFMVNPNARQLAEIGELIDQGKVNVVLHKVFPLEDAAAAQRALEQEHVQGKIVLRVA